MCGGATHLNRVAIGSRAGNAAGADAAIRAADVFDDEVLSKWASHLLDKNPRVYIGIAARRIGHDKRDGARRIGLRPRNP